MPDDIFEVIKSRHNYYRDNYRRLVVVLIVLLAINGILVGVICYQFATRPDPNCFATTADGRIIPILPLNQ